MREKINPKSGEAVNIFGKIADKPSCKKQRERNMGGYTVHQGGIQIDISLLNSNSPKLIDTFVQDPPRSNL